MMLTNAFRMLRRFNDDFPADPVMEAAAVGAVLLARHDHQVAFLGRAQAGVFFCRDHAWLWKELQEAIVKGMFILHTERDIGWWLNRRRVQQRFRSEFGYSILTTIAECMKRSLWWHGNYYLDNVIAIAKRRTRIVKAAAELREALGCGT